MTQRDILCVIFLCLLTIKLNKTLHIAHCWCIIHILQDFEAFRALIREILEDVPVIRQDRSVLQLYRLLVCDRDERALRRISELAKAYMFERDEACGVTRCGDERALHRAMDKQEFSPDILIIDPLYTDGDMNGFATAGALQHRYNCQVIFVCDRFELICDAYNVTHVWFVRKDKMESELPRALAKACGNLRDRAPSRIALRAAHSNVVIDKKDILYAEQTLRRIRLICAGGEEFVLYSKMDDMLNRLHADYFVRCHKSYFVNAAEVQEFTYSRIIMRDGREIPISKTYAHAASAQLSEWFEAAPPTAADFCAAQA